MNNTTPETRPPTDLQPEPPEPCDQTPPSDENGNNWTWKFLVGLALAAGAVGVMYVVVGESRPLGGATRSARLKVMTFQGEQIPGETASIPQAPPLASDKPAAAER